MTTTATIAENGEPRRLPPKTAQQTPVVLSIAGSDSGGGAGIQADLKTFAALGVFGTTAISCVTAQNPDGVSGIAAIEPGMVAEQVRAVCGGFPVAAAKTGMLYSAEIITAVARVVAECAIGRLVVDPVMIATSGARLLREDAIDALTRHLFPRARVVTPNLPEAELLCGRPIRSVDDLCAAAAAIGERHGIACVAKGGHLHGAAGVAPSADVVDVLFDGGAITVFAGPAVDALETHGTGCTFSAALAARLAQGATLKQAVRDAKDYVAAALAGALHAGSHHPLGIGAARA